MKTFEEVWKKFLSENKLQEPDRITRKKERAEKFFGWLKDSGLLVNDDDDDFCRRDCCYCCCDDDGAGPWDY